MVCASSFCLGDCDNARPTTFGQQEYYFKLIWNADLSMKKKWFVIYCIYYIKIYTGIGLNSGDHLK